MQDSYLFSTRTISYTFNEISIMFRRSLAESAGHFWWPEESENVANQDFENLKHFQNPGHLSLTAPSMLKWAVG